MKKFIVSSLLLAATGGAFAQSVVNNPDNRSYLGIRASLDIACPGAIKNGPISLEMYKPGAGFSVGAIYNLPLVANLYFEPGLNLYYDTYGVKDLYASDGLELGNISGSIRKFGMRIPLQFGYHFDFTRDLSVAVFTGPELEVGFTSRMHLNGKAGNVSISESESLYGDDGMSRVDLNWKFGVGLTACHNYYVGIGGGVGMLNMSGDSDIKFHENLVQVTLGYNF